MRTRATRLLSPLWLALVLTLNVAAIESPDRHTSPMTHSEVQALVDELTTALALRVAVTVSIVESNSLLVSVDPPTRARTSYEMSFEGAFLDQLDDEELRAVIAHELGHVWIFSHHPYLQTERGANNVAMRVVSRESLEKVYFKVWAHAGTKGDLARFLGH